MPSNQVFFPLPLQYLNTAFQTPSFVVPSSYQQPPPLPPATSSQRTTHNINYSPELSHAPLYQMDQTMGGHPPTSGGVTTKPNHVNQCKWLMDGIPCGQCFDAFDDLIIHLGREHHVQGPAERKLVCQWCTHRGSCGNQYRRDAYRRHIATHLNISFPCTATDCNKSFSRVDSLRSHVRKKHTEG